MQSKDYSLDSVCRSSTTPRHRAVDLSISLWSSISKISKVIYVSSNSDQSHWSSYSIKGGLVKINSLKLILALPGWERKPVLIMIRGGVKLETHTHFFLLTTGLNKTKLTVLHVNNVDEEIFPATLLYSVTPPPPAEITGQHLQPLTVSTDRMLIFQHYL